MKKKKIVVSGLLVCLLCVNLVSMAVKAETTSTIHSVSSWYDFKDAVHYYKFVMLFEGKSSQKHLGNIYKSLSVLREIMRIFLSCQRLS